MLETIPKTVEIDGKVHKVKVKEVEKIMKFHKDFDIEEALELWACDEGFMTDPEQQKLIAKGTGDKLKVDKEPKKEVEKTPRKPRTTKLDDVKVDIVEKVYDLLEKEGFEKICIEKPGKLITFEKGGEKYKFDLVKQRKPKE